MRRVRWHLLLVQIFVAGSIFSQPVNGERINIWKGVHKPELRGANSRLIVFQPEKSKSNGSSVIICPGGSYRCLGIEHEGYNVAKWLNSLGYTAFVLKYRVGVFGYQYPAMVQDLQRAIELVRENAKNWDLNPNALGVMGFSAGGHLAGISAEYYNENFMQSLGIYPQVSLRPDFIVMVYPVVSMHDSIAHKISKQFLLGNKYSKDLEDKMSLEDHVHQGMPPVFITQAKGDNVVDYRNGLYLFQRLKEIKLPVQYVLYDCNGHGYGISPELNKEASAWRFECEKWFINLGHDIHAITQK
jgi:acetyl esterase/lipase